MKWSFTILNISKDSFIVFDLDDTLYKEVNFLKSAYRHIAQKLEKEIGGNIAEEMINLWYNGEVVFDFIKDKYSIATSIKDLVFEYRYHKPSLKLPKDSKKILDVLSNAHIPVGLITDGRSETQRNKLISLGIDKYFDKIVISEEIGSEKPSQKNYLFFEERYNQRQFLYIGDNVRKDFISPNLLGWKTIGLKDNGENIHTQNTLVEKNYLPQFWVSSLSEIELNFS